MINKFKLIIFITIFMSLTACGGGGDTTDPADPDPANPDITETSSNWDAMKWDQENWK